MYYASMRNKNSYFSRNCQVCNYSKAHPDFHEAILHTKHIDINNKDTVTDVWKRFNVPLPYTSVMQHVRRHIIPAYESFKERMIVRQAISDKKLVTEEDLKKALEGEVGTKASHEQTLDSFIDEFDELIKDGKVKITAQTGLQAIKIKADIEKANKDRKLDAFKMMVGASGQTQQPKG